MKIESLGLKLLRNNEHLQFYTEFKGLVENYTPVTLGIEAVYNEWLPLFISESEAIDKIIKSAFTEVITDADMQRDTIFSGMREAVNAAAKHFRPEVKQAATRLMVIFDHFGNVSIKTYDEETSAINNLINELNSNGAADLATVGIIEWLTELTTSNETFVNLMHSRYTEQTTKSSLIVREVRVAIDIAFRNIINRINALIIVNGETVYAGFVRDLNERIQRSNQQIALRQGRNAKPEIPVV
jgi:hypothetical protein